MKQMVVLVVFLTGLVSPWQAAADAGGVTALALVIGSNLPGPGQERLRFSHFDARRFGDVLSELGGHSVRHLFDPDADAVRESLEGLSDRFRRLREGGHQSAFVFYYSGHARSNALTLGESELPLGELRALLAAVPATVKVIVLDACQTGAFSQAKGLEPARDFSHNSVFGLTNEGMAVIASSAASELAQESDRLEGSFFTHHMVSGLRGAADGNGDGRVTLSEVYQYTYNRTLLDTARTAIGKQHVTLETELSGEGEMVLARPDVASAWLALSEDLEGEVLVYRTRDRHVMAEIHKARKDRLRLALPPGDYAATVRRGERGYHCDIELERDRTTTLDFESCEEIPLETLSAKGQVRRRNEHLFVEFGMGVLITGNTAYESRLSQFGYKDRYVTDNRFRYAVSAFYSPLRNLQIGVGFASLDRGGWEDRADDFSPVEKTFDWTAHRAGVHIRGVLPVANDWITLYLEAAAGLAWASTQFRDSRDADAEVITEERHLSYFVGGNAGLQLNPTRFVGFFVQGGYDYAPIIENLIGDTHNSGGAAIATGVRAGF